LVGTPDAPKGRAQKRVVKDSVLTAALVASIVVDVATCLIWQVSDAPVPQRVYSDLNPHLYIQYCKSAADDIFLPIMLAFKALPGAYGLLLAWRSASLVTEINDSSDLALAMVNLAFISVFVIAVQFLISDNPSALLLLRTLGVVEVSTVTVSLASVRKLYLLAAHGDYNATVGQILQRGAHQPRHRASLFRPLGAVKRRVASVMGTRDSARENSSAGRQASVPATKRRPAPMPPLPPASIRV